MTPLAILNEALYHDRTVQDWHRAAFGPDCWAIDLDLMGACKRCREPLYLIEASTNPDKPTSILWQLAVRADLPALLILHKNGEITGAKIVHAPRAPLNHAYLKGEPEVRRCLERIRSRHIPDCLAPAPMAS
jgi:hypothetical protein